MPKEIVYSATNPYGESDTRRSIIEVAWHREPAGHVQIASLSVAGATLEPLPCVADTEPPTPHLGGIYLDLDREGLNRLIRNLRRARDQAFGADA